MQKTVKKVIYDEYRYIHGQSHEGSTCMVARELANKIGGEIQEFFLPRDFDQSCLGCFTCFKTDLSHCRTIKV